MFHYGFFQPLDLLPVYLSRLLGADREQTGLFLEEVRVQDVLGLNFVTLWFGLGFGVD